MGEEADSWAQLGNSQKGEPRMTVIITVKRTQALQGGKVQGSVSLKGAFPGNFPSSDFLVKLFQLNREVERQAFSESIDL
jgi:hypothetical protein